MAARVSRLWPCSTVVCVATGPSLTAEDIEYCRGRARVVAIKDAVRMAPWADVLYGAGGDRGAWWTTYGPALAEFAGLRYTLDPHAARWATVLKNTGWTGLESHPDGLRTGKNSGYQAINLAVHVGASRIVLLGYDLQAEGDRDHFFGAHPYRTKPNAYRDFRDMFETLVEPLRQLGIVVVNATRRTALACFPQASLEEALG